jgi:Acyl-CoA reductase (LuxC)
MNPIQFLAGVAPGSSFSDALAGSGDLPGWPPFDPRSVAFVSRLSQRLLTHPGIREFPELAALGHWFRGARLRDLARARPTPLDAVVRGRGLAFHLAPANVDSVAMYSWLVSLLAGNANWVRVSQKQSAQLDFVLTVLRQVLDEDIGRAVFGRIVLLTYAHDAAITGSISEAAMLRVVWGGDATVAAIRAIPLRPTAVEICFPDRFSTGALNALALLSLNDKGLQRLAAAFYNDAFWFAQQACSSPRLLTWIGNKEDCELARSRFWTALGQELKNRAPENTPAMAMARLGAVFDLAAAELAHPADPDSHGAFPMRVDMERTLTASMKNLHCGNGLFLEQRLPTLQDLAPQMTDREQTLCVHGFSRDELLDFIDALPARAVDRIAPIGEALSFAPVWDGTDLFSLFTRQISLPTDASLRKDD